MSDTKTEETLLDKLEELTGLEREDEESAEDYKARIVRHFADKYPNTDDGNAAFDKLDSDVTDWVDAATEVVRNNRGAGARKKARLPELEGLKEDGEKPKREKVAAKSRKSGEKKERAAGTGRGKQPLAATFEPAPDGSKASKKLVAVLSQHGFKRQKDLSDGGHIVYADADGKEVHVGPGKGESVYLMGWKVPGQSTHSYGGEALAKHLAG